MKEKYKKMLTRFAPVLGAGAIGVCPLCWAGSASLLSTLSLGFLIPMWQWLVFVLLGLGLVGFILDFRAHKNIYPIILLIVGGVVLYLGRYVYGGADFSGWPIWGSGALIIIGAVIYNKKLFKK